MYTKQDLINKLINNNKSVNFETIYCSLTNWNIEPDYIDENNIEHYNDTSMQKLVHAMDLKKQGKSDCEINSMINNFKTNTDSYINNENISQLADLIVDRISGKLNINEILDAAKLKRDNEILAHQIENLIKNNENLTSKVNFLEKDYSKFKQIYGPVYIKLF